MEKYGYELRVLMGEECISAPVVLARDLNGDRIVNCEGYSVFIIADTNHTWVPIKSTIINLEPELFSKLRDPLAWDK